MPRTCMADDRLLELEMDILGYRRHNEGTDFGETTDQKETDIGYE